MCICGTRLGRRANYGRRRRRIHECEQLFGVLAVTSFPFRSPPFSDALLWVWRLTLMRERRPEELENCFSEGEAPKFVKAVFGRSV